MERKLVKVMFGIPNEGHTDPKAYDDRLTFAFHLGVLQTLSGLGLTESDGVTFSYPEGEHLKFYISSIGNVFTALAREIIADTAIATGIDYLLMIDDDMICPADIFERLYRHKKDIVGALAFTRYPPHKPVIYNLNKGFDHFRHEPYYINYPVFDYPRDTLVECDAIGFGAVLINTNILRALPKPWFMVTSGAGEDIHFCHSAGKAGFKIFMDTSVKLGHIGPPVNVTEDLYLSTENQKNLGREYANK